MSNAEAECLKIEWFYGMELFLKSQDGVQYLENAMGNEAQRDEVEYKVFLMLLESAVIFDCDLYWDAEQSLVRWRVAHRESARNNYLAGKFARDDFWDQKVWDDRFEELKLYAQGAAVIIKKIMDNKKAELEEDFVSERKTPIVPVAEADRLRCAKPSDLVTLQCENDPDAMARVERYLREMQSDARLSTLFSEEPATKPDPGRLKTIFPPPSVPPGATDAGMALPRSQAPSIIPVKKDKPTQPEIDVSHEESDEGDLKTPQD